MSGLRPDAQRLIDEARRGSPAPCDARRRVRAAIAAKVGAAALVTTAHAAGSAAGAGAAAVVLKLGGVALLGGALAVVLSSGPSREAATRPATPRVAAVVTTTPVAPLSTVSTPTTVATISPAPTAPAPTEAVAPSLPAAHPPRARLTPPPFAATLAAETELLREAHAARLAGDAARAITSLDRYARRFPRGLMADEATAERVLALCAAGRVTEARTLAATLAARAEHTPFEIIVRHSCASPSRENDDDPR